MLFVVAPVGSGGEMLASMLPGPPPVVSTVAEGLAIDPEARFVYVFRDPAAAAPTEEAAHAWASATERLLLELEALPPERWCVTSYDQLLGSRDEELARVAGFAGIAKPARRVVPADAREAARRARALFATLPAERVRV